MRDDWLSRPVLNAVGQGFALLWLAALMLPAGCGPSEQRKAELAEKRRIECLDKFCPGDVEPLHDTTKETALKLNGQWYIGPREYFSGRSGAAFYWPSKTPEIGLPNGQPWPEKNKPFYDVAIEIFLGSRNVKNSKHLNAHRYLIDLDNQGFVLEKKHVRPGLDLWIAKEGALEEETWFIATNLKYPDGDPPSISCRGKIIEKGTCTGGFLWAPDIAVGLRFRATHGADWPEIYIEIERILQQLRKV